MINSRPQRLSRTSIRSDSPARARVPPYNVRMSDSLFSRSSEGVARIALPVPLDSLFDYAVPAEIDADVQPGCRVLVSFSGRPMTGVVIARDCVAENPKRTLSEIERIIDFEPALSSELLEILRESAADVLCPVGIALATALPSGSTPRFRTVLELTERGRAALRSGAIRGAARTPLLQLEAQPRSENALAAGPNGAARIRDWLADGLIARRKREQAPVARAATHSVVAVKPGIDVEDSCRTTLARAPKQANLLRLIEEMSAGPEATENAGVPLESLKRVQPRAVSLVRNLRDRGLVVSEKHETERDVLGAPVNRDSDLPLTPDQEQALAPVVSSIHDARSEIFLLHGVTGSGKTEIYLRAVREVLARGRQALILVPEITLTHQIVRRLRARFGDALAVLHSGLSPSERLDQWKKLRQGDTPIAVGARSALFAPLEKLGLIVIDEEHDAAYKNEEGFRYHARTLATMRAERANCPLVLGSATPAIETRYQAEKGDIHRLVLPRRIEGRPLPRVEFVDLVRERERAPRGRKVILTRPLRRALIDTVEEGGQAILFLNRRGFATQIFCFDCGHAERCKNCDVALVYHSSSQQLRCHYCDYNKPPPEACAGCGAPDTALLGIGTERLEEEVRSLLPNARLARLDRDTAQRRGYTKSVLDGLQKREIDILLGTQMVAKGHDFPGVRLVGVILADLGLHLPDFRAAERTFQLLTQVAGRAGRASEPGRVLVQTFVPDHYAIRLSGRHDYEGFYEEEIRQRAALAYPPFSRLAQVMVAAPDEAAAREVANSIASCVREAFADEDSAPEILGPAPAPIPRLRGKYRFQLLIKTVDPQTHMDAGRVIAANATRVPRTVQVSLDVNPVNML